MAGGSSCFSDVPTYSYSYDYYSANIFFVLFIIVIVLMIMMTIHITIFIMTLIIFSINGGRGGTLTQLLECWVIIVMAPLSTTCRCKRHFHAHEYLPICLGAFVALGDVFGFLPLAFCT